MNWQDASEIVTGLVLKGRLAENSVRPEMLISPYDHIIKEVQSGNREPEHLIEKIGLGPVQTCFDAVHNINGTGELDWVGILEQSALAYEAGIKLEKFAQKLQRGDDVDWSQITYYAKLAEQGRSSKFTPLSDVKITDTPYIKTGYDPIDQELCGIPEVGLVIIGGPTGSGKTWFFTKMSSKFAITHPDKVVAFFSLEMLLGEIKSRYKPYNLPKHVEERIMLNPHPTNVEGVIAQSATIDHLGLVGIDFADLLVREEITASGMEKVYKILMLGAKELNVPIVLLAQLTGYNGGIPTPDMMRWTRLAGMLGWSVWTIYNPMKDWFGDEASKKSGLPLINNTAFLCAWKMRGGFWKIGKNNEKVLREDDPGAIMIPFRPELGWGDKHKWFSLKKEAS